MNDATLTPKDDEFIQAHQSTRLLSSFDSHNHLFSDRVQTVERLQSKRHCQFNDEALEVDIRSDLTPAQVVEGKLIRNLRGNPLPVRYLLRKSSR
jgi:hypothetical protein